MLYSTSSQRSLVSTSKNFVSKIVSYLFIFYAFSGEFIAEAMQFIKSVKFSEITYRPMATFGDEPLSFWLDFAEELKSSGDVRHAKLHIDNDQSEERRENYFFVRSHID